MLNLKKVSLDDESDLQKSSTSSEIDRTYKLSDENIITIRSDCFRYSTMLFKPYFDRIDKTLVGSIMKCEIES
jgi:hypothetical protein